MANRSLISYPSHLSGATMAMITGSADASYPVSNLADLKRIRRVFKASASGAIAFKATLSADQSVEFVALVHHNATDGATYQIRCYSDTGLSSLVDDSGTLSFSIDSAAQFPAVTPYALPSAQTVRAVRVDLSDIGVAWQIGGLEVSGLWDFEPVAKRELGLKTNDEVTQHTEGAVHATRMFSPRLITSGREYVTHSSEGWNALDLFNAMGRSEPFVWTRSYEEGGSWQREAALVRFRSAPRVSRGPGTLASFDLPLEEHLR